MSNKLQKLMTKSLSILILKIHDFSENYASLLPEEIQSLHWTQATATVYPIVVIRKVEDDICEDHIVSSPLMIKSMIFHL